MGWQVLTKGRGAALQSKTFVQTFWVQSSTFAGWAGAVMTGPFPDLHTAI